MFTIREQSLAGTRIRKIRKDRNESQQTFAERINISTNFLSEIENGKKGISWETLYNICSTTGVSADYILFGQPSGQDFVKLVIEEAAGLDLELLSTVTDYLNSLLRMKKMEKKG